MFLQPQKIDRIRTAYQLPNRSSAILRKNVRYVMGLTL
ncbi:hypothetical protein BSU04_01530 [Caballeronia sordidicola]|uniref:Uncharacterized protein n=1 Tax=Caballeronia sordidicola TaxID=196367 RepID=A0A226XC69_CABSO|nr:hypothetical protein BSU04_01530 [Caballeronia sordidicola]